METINEKLKQDLIQLLLSLFANYLHDTKEARTVDWQDLEKGTKKVEFKGDLHGFMEWLAKYPTKNKENILVEILAKAESMTTAKEVRHLIKEYIWHEKPD